MTDLLRILISPVAWLAAFSAVYGLQGVVCALPPEGSVPPARLILVLAFFAAVSVQLVLVGVLFSDRFGAAAGFTRAVSRTSACTGLIATIWTLSPTLLATTCG